MEPTIADIVLRLLLAMASGAALGWEREVHRKPAGLRTQMLVALGSATFTLVTLILAAETGQPGTQLDPTRVVQGVVGGIGFLGAGTIIQARGAVTGITTAATIWVVGALGVACGLGYYLLAVITIVFAILILTGVGFLERWLLYRESKKIQAKESPE